MDTASARTRGALLFARPDRRVMLFPGPKAADVINGLITNEVVALAPGSGCYGVALTPKGKVIADVVVLRRYDDLLVCVPEAAFAGWGGMIRKYVNPRLSRYEDRSEHIASLDIAGPDAGRLLKAAGADLPAGEEPYAHNETSIAGHAVTLVRLPDHGIGAFAILALPTDLPAIQDVLAGAGATVGAEEEREVLRVEAGRPRWGMDMDENTLSQEANMDDLHAISYTKGCYTGQETVARLHFRGHVNKFLRGVRLSAVGVPRGATLLAEGSAGVGEIRSSVVSPRLGPIALAMVRREVADGARLRVHWEGGEADAEVVALPFQG